MRSFTLFKDLLRRGESFFANEHAVVINLERIAVNVGGLELPNREEYRCGTISFGTTKKGNSDSNALKWEHTGTKQVVAGTIETICVP